MNNKFPLPLPSGTLGILCGLPSQRPSKSYNRYLTVLAALHDRLEEAYGDIVITAHQKKKV